MAVQLEVKTADDLQALRLKLAEAEQRAVKALEGVLTTHKPLQRLKFERLGVDPIDHDDPQNIAEQIDQQATYEAAIDALELLMSGHPGKKWKVAPGATGAGHDIASADGEVAAEVFAAVKPTNNDKLNDDIEMVAAFRGRDKYVIYRSPARLRGEQVHGSGVVIVSLGM